VSAYKGFTAAQAKAHQKYMEGQATIQLRMSEDKREEIKARAAALGVSVNAYILGLVEADLAGGTRGVSAEAVEGGVTPPNSREEEKDS